MSEIFAIEQRSVKFWIGVGNLKTIIFLNTDKINKESKGICYNKESMRSQTARKFQGRISIQDLLGFLQGPQSSLLG